MKTKFISLFLIMMFCNLFGQWNQLLSQKDCPELLDMVKERLSIAYCNDQQKKKTEKSLIDETSDLLVKIRYNCNSQTNSDLDNFIKNLPTLVDCKKINSNYKSTATNTNNIEKNGSNSNYNVITDSFEKISSTKNLSNSQSNGLQDFAGELGNIATQISTASQKTADVRLQNNVEINKIRQEQDVKNLTDEEIDNLLNNSTPENYATVFIYELYKGPGKWDVIVNGSNPVILAKKEKLEYRSYINNKITIQFSVRGMLGETFPLQTHSFRIRKGKTYHYAISGTGYKYTLEELETEPQDKKIKSKYSKAKSDLE